MSNTNRPYLGEFLDLTYSAEAATGLAATNDLVQQLRAIPDKLLTPVLLDDRNRVLDKALPDLLGAHRDARAAGADIADAELAAGLEHIRVEVVRIMAACRSNAGDTLAIQGRYLEQVYPVAEDDPLAIKGSEDAVDKLVSPPVEGSRRKVDRRSMEALFRTVSEVAAKKKADAGPPTWRSRLLQIGWGVAAPFVVLLIPVLTVWGLLYAFVALYQHNRTPDPTYRPDRVELTAKIDRIRRSMVADDYNPSGPKKPAAIVDLHGLLHNRTRDHSLQRQAVHVDLYACPNDRAPLKRCSWVTSDERDIVDDVLHPGVSARWKRQAQLMMPDVTGILRAVVYPDVSIFDDTPMP